ncbi:hypothetical protein ABZ883_04715 [Streptomyces sp. NPDC046977]|uniref:hypothetical protein n=1 Tax=Streptomyces sp. NPDC046977 TaxID=3154703 RepID=UPI0033F926A8
MQKIPTLFVRDPDDRRHVTREVTPGCEWVLAGEGTPTHKYDGTCVMHDDEGRWWARREVKPDKKTPPDYVLVQHDEVTGKSVGWEPIGQSPFAAFHAQALANAAKPEVHGRDEPWAAGTYELIGPKINGNPEQQDRHWLIAHASAVPLAAGDRTFEGIRTAVLNWHRAGVEGLVFHHPDGRMAKIKGRDFA